jgi:tetratricopeptide (TPR) repeat protein
VTLRLVLCLLSLLASAAAAAETPGEQAISLLNAGRRAEALQAFEAIIAAKPADPSAALFYAGRIEIEDGNWQAAKPMLQRLVKLRPGSFPAWELMIQTYQAAGETDNRDHAIESLYDAWRSAPDAQTRSRIAFARDRIAGPKRTVVALEMLQPGGGDIVRFRFQPADYSGAAAHVILLRSDADTNTQWRDTGTITEDKIVYHLDTIEQLPDGKTSQRPYAFYLEPPGYDEVRAKVVQILSGAIQPLSGDADPFWLDGADRQGTPVASPR